MAPPGSGRSGGAAAALGGRRPALADPHRRPLSDVPRHDDRQRRSGRRAVEPARRRLSAAVGRERLRADLRRSDAGGGHAGRPPGAQARDAGRRCRVHRRLAVRRAGAHGVHPDRRPGDHGRRRRRERAGHAVDHPPPLPRARAPRPGAGRLGRGRRAGAGHGSGDRRRPGGSRRLARRVLVQPRRRPARLARGAGHRARELRPAGGPHRRRRLSPGPARAGHGGLRRHPRRDHRLSRSRGRSRCSW